MGNRIKTKWHHNDHLETDDESKTCEELSGSVNVLKPAQEAWKQQHNSSFNRSPKREEQRCVERFVGAHVIDTDGNVKSHDRIVEKILIKLSDFLVAQDDEANKLRSDGLISEIRICNLSYVVVDTRMNCKVAHFPNVFSFVS